MSRGVAVDGWSYTGSGTAGGAGGGRGAGGGAALGSPSTWSSGSQLSQRQVPVPRAQQGHRGGYDDHPDEGGVHQQGDGDAEAHLLEHHQLPRGEPCEDDDDDQRGPGDDPAGRGDAVHNGVDRLAGDGVALTDPAEQEHAGVHR